MVFNGVVNKRHLFMKKLLCLFSKKRLFVITILIILGIFVSEKQHGIVHSGNMRLILFVNKSIYSVKTFAHDCYSLFSTYKDNIRLHEENKTLHKQIIDLQYLKHENNDLRKTLSFHNTQNNQIVTLPASIVRDIHNDIFIIFGGTNSNIACGNIVFYDDQIVGRIIEVFATHSIAVSLNEKRCVIKVRGLESGAFGVAHGAMVNGKNKTILIPQSGDVFVIGERIVFCDGASVLQVGIVEKFEDEVYILTCENKHLPYVCILLNKNL
jgi:cell shape-determining protein MreC